MQRIGFPRPRMKEERRIAILPVDIETHIEHPEFLFFERGYGRDYGISDEAYRATGAHVVETRRAYSLEVLCQPKFCSEDLIRLGQNIRTIFGWLHLDKDADKDTIEIMKNRKLTGIAYEFMIKGGRNVFHVNSILTGQMGILHSMPYAGKSPQDCRVAVIGRGVVGTAARLQLQTIGVREIDVYHTGNINELKPKVKEYDVIVECACTNEQIYDSSVFADMKPGALFVDMGRNCMWDRYSPRSIYAPIVHINDGRNPVYCIRNIPTLAYQTATKHNSKDVAPYLNVIANGKMDETLRNAIVIDKGNPVPGKI